jgi:hypothetical protein
LEAWSDGLGKGRYAVFLQYSSIPTFQYSFCYPIVYSRAVGGGFSALRSMGHVRLPDDDLLCEELVFVIEDAKGKKRTSFSSWGIRAWANPLLDHPSSV